jgi:hypothetical protein
VVLQPLPPPDRLALDWEQVPVCFVPDDGTPLSGLLAEELTGRGWQVVILQWPQDIVGRSAGVPDSIQRVSLAGFAEDQMRAGLEEAAKVYGPASTVICLEPAWLAGSQTEAVAAPIQEQYLQGVFWLAKALKPDLTGNLQGGRNAFLTVAHLDGVLGTSGAGNWSAVSGGLFGLVKTLNLEWEHVFCRALDLHPDLPANQAAAYILAELQDPDRLLVEVGYSLQQRVTLTLADAAARSTQ